MMSKESTAQSTPNDSHPHASTTPDSFSTIFVPIDQHTPSDNAVRLGIDLAKRLNASIVLMHLEVSEQAQRKLLRVDATGVATLDDEGLDTLVRALLGRYSTQALDQIEHIEETAQPARHSAVDEILSGAVDVQADLIVMGMRHHSTTGKFLAGGVVDKVLNRAPCPVTIVS